MTIHDGAWPDTITDAKVKQLLVNYLRFSNASNPHHPDQADEEKFASLFTTHGVYQLAQKKAKGQKEIVALRKALFANIPHRDHQAVKFFTFGSNQHEIMVEGKVYYKHHHGHETETEWAARLQIKEEGGEPKFELLQIIIDTAAHV